MVKISGMLFSPDTSFLISGQSVAHFLLVGHIWCIIFTCFTLSTLFYFNTDLCIPIHSISDNLGVLICKVGLIRCSISRACLYRFICSLIYPTIMVPIILSAIFYEGGNSVLWFVLSCAGPYERNSFASTSILIFFLLIVLLHCNKITCCCLHDPSHMQIYISPVIVWLLFVPSFLYCFHFSSILHII